MGVIKLKKANEEVVEETAVNEQVYGETETTEIAEQWDDPAVLSEDKAQITENSRHYVLNNGTEKSVISGAPMNYYDEDDKKWRPIDNSLTEKADAFEAKCGKFKTEISKAEKGKAVKLSGKDIALSWEYLGKKTERASIMPMNEEGMSVTTEEKPQTVLNVRQKVKGVEKTFGGEAVYENVENNTDLEYKLQGNNIKENIIVKEKAEEYKYLFALNTEGLKLRLSEDNTSIELYSETVKENGETEEKKEFTIPSPYMYDANGEMSEEVYYELEPAEDGKYVFAVVASEEWINAPERTFPVTIDPQIVMSNSELFTKQVEYRTVSSSSGSGTSTSSWRDTPSSYIKVYKDGSMEYRTKLTIKKSLMNVLNKRIVGVKLILIPVGSFSGRLGVNGFYKDYDSSNGNLETDIASTFKGQSDESDFSIYIVPSSYNYINGNFAQTPIIEIEYLTNEGTRSTKKAFTMAGVATGEVNLATGDTVVSFCDMPASDSVMGMEIGHVYKKSSEDNFVGENWRLTLNETFVKDSSSALDANYVYTDEKGDKHGFRDYYYYFNSTGKKQYVTSSKTNITVQPDGTLIYNGNTVYAEYRSATGLKAITEISDFSGYKILKQRNDEYNQLEEQVKSYKYAYEDFVLMNTLDGTYNNSVLKESQIFTDYSSYTQMLLPKSEALQYKTLCAQKSGLEKYNNNLSDIIPGAKNNSIKEQIFSLKSSIYETTGILKRYLEGIKLNAVLADYIKLFFNLKDQDLLDKVISIENKLNAEEKIPLELVDIVVPEDKHFFEEYFGTDLSEEDKERIPKQNGYTLKSQFRQRNLLLEQLAVQQNELNKQVKSITDQITLIKSKKAMYSEQVQGYYKEYKNKSTEFEKLKYQTPVNFLTDGQIIKGYNSEGKLVAVYDNYENYAVIEYEKYYVSGSSGYRISRLSDNNGKSVAFAYTPTNKLLSITNTRGKKTVYEYDGEAKRLEKVHYDGGKEFSIVYTQNNIKSIESSEKLKTELKYEDKKLTVTNSSKVSGISNAGSSEGETEFSTIVIEFNYTNATINYVTITEDSNEEKYLFDSNRNCYGHYVAKNGTVTAAEQYEYVPYWNGTTKQVNPRSVVKQAKKESLYKTQISTFTFTAGDTETITLDQFNNPLKKTISPVKMNIAGTNTQTTTVDYTYDENQKLTEEKTTVVYTNPAKTIVSYKKYLYNVYGDVIRTESYVEGEEKTTGKSIEETVYDEKGRVKKSFTYNSLDSSSKFYTESEYSENGQVLADIDETGENKTKYEYIDGTSVVRTQTLPNGSKLSYGHDIDDTVTAITQSTEGGEENSNRTSYTCGLVTEVRSGNNIVQYAYDAKRRIKSVNLDGKENYVQYAYTDKTTETINGVSKAVNKVTATYTSRVWTVSDVFLTSEDLNGNVLKTVYNGAKQAEYTYTADDKIEKVTDYVSGRTITYVYDSLDRVTSCTEKATSGGTVILTEAYTYNNDGTLASKAISGGATQTYEYVYKNNAARDLDYFTVRNMKVSPKTDCLGRNTGKETSIISVVNGETKIEKIYEEIITYRKVGDHATNMPSTVRYGDKQNETFGIRDSLKYTYDEMGNISKVYENGDLSVRYTYDKLSRLVREDNKAIGETYLFDYDNNGNILNKRTLPFTLKTKEEAEELISTAEEYTYDGDKLLSYNEESFAYDGLGNPIVYRGRPVTWEKGRRLVSYKGTMFTYDGQGRRTGKGNIGYTYGSDGKLLKQSDGWEFLYDNGGVMGFIYGNDTTDNKYLYRKDILGNITGIVDRNGKIVVKYTYDAWGNHAAVSLNLKDGKEQFCDITDETISFTDKYAEYKTLAEKNPFRYRGYYYDIETGFYFLKTRYYDPEIGRFITIDDISYLAPDTINGLNLYAYCGNNPVMRVDLEGRKATDVLDFLLGFLENYLINVSERFRGTARHYAEILENLSDDLIIYGYGTRTVVPNRLKWGYKSLQNSALFYGKLSGAVGNVAKSLGYAMVAAQCISTITQNFTNSNLSIERKISDSIVDVTAILFGVAVGAKIGGAIGNLIPIPIVGALIGTVIGGIVGGFVSMIYSSRVVKDAFYNVCMDIGEFFSGLGGKISNAWNKFWGWIF